MTAVCVHPSPTVFTSGLLVFSLLSTKAPSQKCTAYFSIIFSISFLGSENKCEFQKSPNLDFIPSLAFVSSFLLLVVVKQVLHCYCGANLSCARPQLSNHFTTSVC